MADDVTKEIDRKLKDSQKQASEQINKRLDIVTAAAEEQQKQSTENITRHAEFLTNFMESTVKATTIGIASSLSDASKQVEEVEKKKGLGKKLLGGMGRIGKFGTRQTLGRVMFKEKLGGWGKGPSQEDQSAEKQREEESKRQEINEQINTQIVKNTSMLSWLQTIYSSLMDMGASMDVMVKEFVGRDKFAEEIEREKRVRELKMMSVQERMAEALEKDKEVTVNVSGDDKKGTDWEKWGFLTSWIPKKWRKAIIAAGGGFVAASIAGAAAFSSGFITEWWSVIKGMKFLSMGFLKSLFFPIKKLNDFISGRSSIWAKGMTTLTNIMTWLFGKGSLFSRAVQWTAKRLSGMKKFLLGDSLTGAPNAIVRLLDAMMDVGGFLKTIASPFKKLAEKIGLLLKGPLGKIFRVIGKFAFWVGMIAETAMGAWKGWKEGHNIAGMDIKGGLSAAFLRGAEGLQYALYGWIIDGVKWIIGQGMKIVGNITKLFGWDTNLEEKGKKLLDIKFGGADGIFQRYIMPTIWSLTVYPFDWLAQRVKAWKKNIGNKIKKMGDEGIMKLMGKLLVGIVSNFSSWMAKGLAKVMGIDYDKLMLDRDMLHTEARREKTKGTARAKGRTFGAKYKGGTFLHDAEGYMREQKITKGLDTGRWMKNFKTAGLGLDNEMIKNALQYKDVHGETKLYSLEKQQFKLNEMLIAMGRKEKIDLDYTRHNIQIKRGANILSNSQEVKGNRNFIAPPVINNVVTTDNSVLQPKETNHIAPTQRTDEAGLTVQYQ